MKRNRLGFFGGGVGTLFSGGVSTDGKTKSCHGSDVDDSMSVVTTASTNSSGSSRQFSPTAAASNKTSGTGASRKLGTLNGVFLPCLQTILGVILFLRLTHITSQAGCVETTLIILTCVTSTFLTSLSLSAMATNGTICAGGPYYIISRTLGSEIGGSLGLLFYLGTTMAASMYVLGAIEALQSTPGLTFGHAFVYDTQIACFILMFVLTCVVSVGVKYVNMASNIFLGMVFLSIFCMCLGCVLFASGVFLGRLQPWDLVFFDNVWSRYEPDPVTGIMPDFFSLLAIFYPSVTGILAGSNRSAVLADPGKSIPKGTISAILTTTTIYISVVWLFGLTIANPTMKTDKFVTAAIAFPNDQVVKIGVIVSCIGAALQCLVGAPRLLAAISMDDSMPFLRNLKPESSTAEPRRAIWVTWMLASLPTMAGNLDHITPIITMFYLLMYSGINLSCFFLGVLKSPGFRPTFKYFHWSISLLGFVWCLGLALVISWYTAMAALGLFAALYVYNKKQKAQKDWGDVGDALRYTTVTTALRALAIANSEDFHAKNWRPQLLSLVDTDDCGNPTNLHVLSLASQLKKGRGINMVVSIMDRSEEGMRGFDAYDTCELVSHSKTLLKQHMNRESMDGFAEVSATTSKLSEAIWAAVVHSGLGPLSPNTVMLSYPSILSRRQRKSDLEWDEDYVIAVNGIMNLKKAVILFHGNDHYPTSTDIVPNATIDVWWIVHDGGLLLLLPYVLSKNGVWGKRGAKLRLFAVTTSPTENPERLRDAVTNHLSQVRISASVTIIDMSDSTIAADMRHVISEDNCLPIQKSIARHKHINANLAGVESSTHDATVGEVFSNITYDVPYQMVALEAGDIESGGTASTPCQPSSVNAVAPLSANDNNARIDDESDGRCSEENDGKARTWTAQAFNRVLREHSSGASLVVTNMPLIRPGRPASDFFDYVDTCLEGLDNVLLIRGSGAEVITTYA